MSHIGFMKQMLKFIFMVTQQILILFLKENETITIGLDLIFTKKFLAFLIADH